MDKVVLIIPDNNKGKFVTKGFSLAFSELSFFVYEKKIPDLNDKELNKISPSVIFIYWTGLNQREIVCDVISKYVNTKTVFIHCDESGDDIPKEYKNQTNHYIFISNAKTKKNIFKYGIAATEYKTKFRGYKYGITFAGNPDTKEREEILSSLINNYGAINIYCRSYNFYKSLEEIQSLNLMDKNSVELYRKSYRGYVESRKKLANIFVSSKINIDIISKNKKAINYRCLEVMASGGFLISQKNADNIKYFDEGKDFETFETKEELIDKIEFYLKNLNIAQSIALRGRINAVNNFSCTDILKNMLKVIYGKNIGS